MGTPHINAEMGDIAETVLLPGDPLRAKWIAETFLEDVKQYNNVRGMMGFTGTYKGKRVSVQGTGMGVPSLGIYVNELIRFFGVKKVIRVGSAGSYQADVKVRDLVIAMSSATTTPFSSHMPPSPGIYTPTADPYLFMQAVEKAKALGMKPKLGSVLTSDAFYDDYDENDHAGSDKKSLKKWEKWAKMGILAVEMESHGLYSIGSAFRDQGVQALSLLTISDSLVTGEATTAEERQTTFKEMIELALSLA